MNTLAPSPELVAAWRARAVLADDGHLLWVGAFDSHGTAVMKHHGGRYTALRLAYVIANGVEPDGRVQAGCDLPGCVAPAHVDDYARRQRDRAALRVVLGTRPRRSECRHGHDQGVHGVLNSAGHSYCLACDQVRKARAAA